MRRKTKGFMEIGNSEGDSTKEREREREIGIEKTNRKMER